MLLIEVKHVNKEGRHLGEAIINVTQVQCFQKGTAPGYASVVATTVDGIVKFTSPTWDELREVLQNYSNGCGPCHFESLAR